MAQNNDWPGLNAASSPVQVPGTNWSAVTGLDYVTVAVKTDGELWAWGLNTSGQLGQNNTTNYSSPVQIPGTDWVTTHGKWIADGSRAKHLSILKNP